MRPSILNPLFADASGLKGVGPKLDRLLARFLRPGTEERVNARIIDLVFHLPSGVIDRRHQPHISELPPYGIVTIEITVGAHRPPPPHNKRLPYRVECQDGTGHLSLVFFHAYADHIRRLLPQGETRFVSGRIEWYGAIPQIVHPDHVVNADEFAAMPLIEPVYPLTEGLSPKVLGRVIRAGLEKVPPLPEWQDAAWLAARGWPSFSMALKAMHQPDRIENIQAQSRARQRLGYDEFLANQLALSIVRGKMKRAAGRRLGGTGDKRARILAALPYSLTRSQLEAVNHILRDMAAPERMLRLLQGDVGSGKTAVALLALAAAVEAGAQGALMAPTEILARQHYVNFEPLGRAAGISVGLLTGREKGRMRASLLRALGAGEIDILIGTHALFQEGVEFKDLGLVVIDEQHRFGVHQRLALQTKAAQAPDLLVMTATPIPRTLALTIYGEMDVSNLTEKPAGRQPVDTRTISMDRLDEVVEGLERLVAGGARAYWICPLVEESEISDLAAAEARFAALEKRFGHRVALIHGRMKSAKKDLAMARFKNGDASLLVSTTVVEVGVDIPEATAIVIENSERFGLAQLHQLRGRVGRGSATSSCILLYQPRLGETAKERLGILRETDDGFRIAEEDLRLRGAGEMLGVRQSGLPVFRLAEISVHGELLATARDDAALFLSKDPQLRTTRGEALRMLLYLFERDEAVRLISAG